MKIKIRNVCGFKEVIFTHGETCVVVGLLDEDEMQDLVEEFNNAIEELGE